MDFVALYTVWHLLLKQKGLKTKRMRGSGTTDETQSVFPFLINVKNCSHYDVLEASCWQHTAFIVPYLWHFIWNIKYVEILSLCRPHFADQCSMTLEKNLHTDQYHLSFNLQLNKLSKWLKTFVFVKCWCCSRISAGWKEGERRS